jgi:hypothetical protein
VDEKFETALQVARTALGSQMPLALSGRVGLKSGLRAPGLGDVWARKLEIIGYLTKI